MLLILLGEGESVALLNSMGLQFHHHVSYKRNTQTNHKDLLKIVNRVLLIADVEFAARSCGYSDVPFGE